MSYRAYLKSFFLTVSVFWVVLGFLLLREDTMTTTTLIKKPRGLTYSSEVQPIMAGNMVAQLSTVLDK